MTVVPEQRDLRQGRHCEEESGGNEEPATPGRYEGDERRPGEVELLLYRERPEVGDREVVREGVLDHRPVEHVDSGGEHALGGGGEGFPAATSPAGHGRHPGVVSEEGVDEQPEGEEQRECRQKPARPALEERLEVEGSVCRDFVDRKCRDEEAAEREEHEHGGAARGRAYKELGVAREDREEGDPAEPIEGWTTAERGWRREGASPGCLGATVVMWHAAAG